MSWHADTNQWKQRAIGGFLNNAAVSADGSLLVAEMRVLNPQLVVTSIAVRSELFGAENRRGAKLHDSGSLLYVPYHHGIEIFDVHHGDLRQRIPLRVEIPFVENGLDLDATGQKMFLITKDGFAIIEAGSVPLSLGSVFPAVGPSTGGTQVTLRGSGFEPGISVLFGASPAHVTFLDSTTLHVTSPGTSVGSTQITLKNPDGTVYSLDNAYTAQ